MAPFLPAAPHIDASGHPQDVSRSFAGCSAVNDTPQLVGEQLAESVNLRPGATVLDVSAGSGNTTLSFARRWHRVVSIDRTPAPLGCTAARARAEGLDVNILIAGPDHLPFAENGFDAVVSVFGVMHTPDHHATAAELIRVCRPGGTVGLTTWTTDSFLGHLSRVTGRCCARAAEADPSDHWGDPAWLTETFRRAVSELRITPASFVLRYRDPAHLAESLRGPDGPICRGPNDQISDLIARFNMATDGSIAIRAGYLRVLLRKRDDASSASA